MARFTGIDPLGSATVGPTVPAGDVRILFYGDSSCARFSLAPAERTLIGKIRGSTLTVPEYGHMELGHLFQGERATVFHYAIAGQRLATVGSPSGPDLRNRVYEAFGLPANFRFEVIFVRMGTNDIKYHVTAQPAVDMDSLFSWFGQRLMEIQRAFRAKVVYLGGGITSLDGNFDADASTNHILGGSQSRSEVIIDMLHV